jgi:peptidoglycan/LPS O-acetylase OafA/YrhL
MTTTATTIPRADVLGPSESTAHALAAPGRPYWAALDGLRGTAVLAVLVCHYSFLLPKTPAVDALANGWAGVDLFFVLSGFLITGILLDSRGGPNYFRNFYARRALRIFPLYFVFLAVVLLSSLAWNSGTFDPMLWKAQPWLWTYTANYWMAAQPTWNPWTEVLIPLWSLSVEEQFYLVWPMVVYRFSSRALVRICFGVFAGALVLRLILTAAHVEIFPIYIMTPTRADALAAGALVALLIRQPDGEQRARKLAGRAGIVSIVVLSCITPGFNPVAHPWLAAVLFSVLAILFASLLVWAIDARALRGLANRFYSHPVLRTVGGYSYGIYVLHLPLLYVATWAFKRWGFYDPMQPTWGTGAALIAASAMLCALTAFASFHLLERPFLKLKRSFQLGGGEVFFTPDVGLRPGQDAAGDFEKRHDP